MLTLKDVLPYFEGKKSKLADALGISRQALSKWQLDEPIPQKHQLRLQRDLIPNRQISDLPASNKLTSDANTSNKLMNTDNPKSSDYSPAPVNLSERRFTKSRKLEQVLYDIRGPVLDKAHKMEEEGHRILKLNIGNPAAFDLFAPDEITQDVIYNLSQADGYCESRGLFPARKAIMQQCQLQGIRDVGMSDIYMGNGVSELIVMCMQGLINNGDDVLVPAPDYPLWTAAVRLAGGNAVHYLCDEQTGWQPDIEDIKRKITPNTKAIVVINPNNPTGAVYERPVLEDIAKVAVDNGLVLFADEIYDKILYDDAQHIPMASITKETLVVTFNGLSKSYRLAGYRCGWMYLSGAKNRATDFIEGIQMLSSMRLCANVPAQLAVQTALGGYQSINDLTKPGGRLCEQRNLAWRKLNDIPGVSCVKPKGAMYLFPKLDARRFNIQDDEKLVLDLLQEQHILLVHGKAFNWPDPNHLRLVFLPRVQEIGEAVDKLGIFLDKYKQ